MRLTESPAPSSCRKPKQRLNIAVFRLNYSKITPSKQLNARNGVHLAPKPSPGDEPGSELDPSPGFALRTTTPRTSPWFSGFFIPLGTSLNTVTSRPSAWPRRVKQRAHDIAIGSRSRFLGPSLIYRCFSRCPGATARVKALPTANFGHRAGPVIRATSPPLFMRITVNNCHKGNLSLNFLGCSLNFPEQRPSKVLNARNGVHTALNPSPGDEPGSELDSSPGLMFRTTTPRTSPGSRGYF